MSQPRTKARARHISLSHRYAGLQRALLSNEPSEGTEETWAPTGLMCGSEISNVATNGWFKDALMVRPKGRRPAKRISLIDIPNCTEAYFRRSYPSMCQQLEPRQLMLTGTSFPNVFVRMPGVQNAAALNLETGLPVQLQFLAQQDETKPVGEAKPGMLKPQRDKSG